METYNPDQELQALRTWFEENWLALVVGLVVGLALILGWKGWNYYTQTQAQQASGQYESQRAALQAGDLKTAEALTRVLTGEYTRTPYAALAALSLASKQVERGQFDAALAQLQWVAEDARDRKVRHVARLRRARLLWSLGRADEALAQLETRKPGSYAALYAELRGDIYASQGKPDEARQAYQAALDAEPSPEARAAIELKLNDLGAPLAPVTGG